MEVLGTARFLIVALATFLPTGVVLGGGGYLTSQLMVPSMRDVFRTAAFEFDLARGWWCELDGSTYVCSPPGKRPYAAIVVLAMKERNEQDNLKAYEDYLTQECRVLFRFFEAFAFRRWSATHRSVRLSSSSSCAWE